MIRLPIARRTTALAFATALAGTGLAAPASANCNPITGICNLGQNFPPPSPPKVPPHPVQPAQPNADALAAAGAGMAVGLAVGALAAEAAEEGRNCHIEERRARDEAGEVFTRRVKVCE